MVIFHIGTKLTGVVNGVKTILSVNFTDAGRYECVVNNSLGNKSASFNLTVKGNQIALNHNYVFKPEW